MADAHPDVPPMLRDVHRQPETLSTLLRRAEDFVGAGQAVLVPGSGGRLFVCGCGDGLFAAQAARGLAEELGLDWRPIGALDLVLSAGRLTAADRVIAISMSGNVDRTVEAAEAVAARGVPLLALVNGSGGRLGTIARAKVSLDIADVAPFLCGTSSYTATIAALMLLAGGGAGDTGMAARLAGVPDAVAKALAAAEGAALLPSQAPSGARFLAAGPEIGTAQYGAAKLVELTRVPAWHGDLEEFAHSQYWAMPTRDLVVAIATDPALARYATDSCEALGQLGVATLAIDTSEAPVATAAQRVTLPAIEPILAPLLSAIPLQRLAYHLAEAGGLDPNTRLHLKGDETRFRVSRLLTRRSLLGTGQ